MKDSTSDKIWAILKDELNTHVMGHNTVQVATRAFDRIIDVLTLAEKKDPFEPAHSTLINGDKVQVRVKHADGGQHVLSGQYWTYSMPHIAVLESDLRTLYPKPTKRPASVDVFIETPAPNGTYSKRITRRVTSLDYPTYDYADGAARTTVTISRDELHVMARDAGILALKPSPQFADMVQESDDAAFKVRLLTLIETDEYLNETDVDHFWVRLYRLAKGIKR